MAGRGRKLILVLLVGLNLLLLGSLLTGLPHLPLAVAQQTATGPQRFLMVTGEVQDGLDAVYMIDTQQKRLYVLTAVKGGVHPAVRLSDVRDLAADFRTRPAPPTPESRRR